MELSFQGNHGADGSSGTDGYCGNPGQDGGNGYDGNPGQDGEYAPHIDIIMTRIGDKISTHIINGDDIQKYLHPIHCTLLINTSGGNGGDGGYGGSGGARGKADANGNCGSNGQSGNRGIAGRGGHGGDIRIYSDMIILDLANIIIPMNHGGRAGNGYYQAQDGRKGNIEYIIISKLGIDEMLAELRD